MVVIFILNLREEKMVNLIKNATKERGKTFTKAAVNFICNNAKIRSYQVCVKLYNTGYNFS